MGEARNYGYWPYCSNHKGPQRAELELKDVDLIEFWVAYVVLTIIFIGLPFAINRYFLYSLVLVGLFIILTFGLNLIFGYTGQVQLCHGVFYAVGAYSSALLALRLGLSFWITLPLSVMITALVAFLIGIPFLRIKGPYFAIGTMVLGFVVTAIIHNSDKLNGGVRLPGIPPINPISLPILGKISFTSLSSQYYLILAFVLLTIFVVKRIVSSRVGRAFNAIRENEELAEVTGVNVKRFKILSFVIGSGIAGVAGALYSGVMGAIDPGLASAHTSFVVLTMLVVGGTGTILGSIIGPAVIWIIPEILHVADIFRLVLYGLVIILVSVFMPYGIVGGLRSMAPRISRLLRYKVNYVDKD